MSVAVTSGYYGAGTTDNYVGKFIPEIWSGKLQQKFYEATVLSAISNNQWEGEIRDQGDKVKIRTVPSININNYTKGLSLTSQVPETSIIELNIDKGKYFQVVADDIDKTQADLKLMDIFSNEAAQQMKISIDTDVLTNLVNTAATGNKGRTAGVISADLDLGDGVNATVGSRRSMVITSGTSTSTKRSPIDYLIDMGQAMDEQNLPEDGRFVVVPAWFAAMIKKSDLRDASITGDGSSIARNGRVGMLDRFTVYVSNLLPFQTSITDTDAGTGKKGFHVFAGIKEGLTFASQITKVETMRSQTTFGDIMRGLNVYGYKVVTPKAMVEGFVSR